MSWFAELWRRLLYLTRRAQFDHDLAEEMRLHLDLRAAERTAGGTTAKDAESEARRRFGNVTRMREDSRQAWSWTFWETFAQDVRYGIRALLANRGLTLTAVLSLTLGIGANTALFSIVNAVMLRSLPVDDPHALVQVESDGRKFFTNPIWEAIRDHQTAFSSALAYSPSRFDLTEGGESKYARGIWVSGDFFQTVGVPAIRGRVFTREDDRHGCGASGPVAVISNVFWRSHFASDPAIVGKVVRLDRHAFQIIGVTPPWFTGLDVDQNFDIAVPIGCEPIVHTDRSALKERSWWWLRIVGRLHPGESLQEANARIRALSPQVARATVPPNWDATGQKRYLDRTYQVRPAGNGFSATGTRYRTALLTLMAAVGLVLLIACANIANLMLARATARQREISVRLAIGASRARLIRQLLTESLILSFLGAAGGLLFAVWGGSMILRMLSTTRDHLQLDTRPDWNVLAFTAIVAAGTALLFGMMPALRATSQKPNDVLKERARGAVAGSSRFHIGKALVAAQVGLSLLLLVGAGLFVETLRNLLTLDVGFDRNNVLVVNANVLPSQVPKELRLEAFARVLDRIRTIPGVVSASASDSTPVANWVWNENVSPEGYHGGKSPDDTLVYFNSVTPRYFETMRIGLVAGRDFDRRDTHAGQRVMVIGEQTAAHFWPSENPIGKVIRMEGAAAPKEQVPYVVIGVVRDVKYEQLTEKTLMTGYVASAQVEDPGPSTSYEVRAAGKPEALLRDLRTAITEVNPGMSVEFHTLETQIADSLMQQRLLAFLSTFFGLVALGLAVTGLYGVVAYMTTRRRNEIGIRVALGARYTTLLRLVLGDVALMLVVGLLLGIAGALIAGKLVATLCYGVSPGEVRVLAGAALVLSMATGIAGFLPARRAARMDAMAALREE